MAFAGTAHVSTKSAILAFWKVSVSEALLKLPFSQVKVRLNCHKCEDKLPPTLAGVGRWWRWEVKRINVWMYMKPSDILGYRVGNVVSSLLILPLWLFECHQARLVNVCNSVCFKWMLSGISELAVETYYIFIQQCAINFNDAQKQFNTKLNWPHFHFRYLPEEQKDTLQE